MSGEEPAKEEMLPEHYEDFMDCARYGETEGVGIYLEHGADVNWADEFGTTPLHKGEGRCARLKFCLDKTTLPRSMCKRTCGRRSAAP